MEVHGTRHRESVKAYVLRGFGEEQAEERMIDEFSFTLGFLIGIVMAYAISQVYWGY